MRADRLIAIAAFRYALGRMTYMPEHVGNWLIKNRDALPEHEHKLIVREIDEAERLRGLGMDCDVATWRRVRKAFAAAPTEAGGTGDGEPCEPVPTPSASREVTAP